MGFGWAGRVSFFFFFLFFRVSIVDVPVKSFPFTAMNDQCAYSCLSHSICVIVSLLPCRRLLSKCMDS
jgi:hypothetical protein